jgi:hypothetical protein
MLASLALAFLAAPSPAAPVKAAPMTVRVETAATADAAAQAWASDLRTALAARKDEFRPVKPGEAAELVVRIDSVAKGQAGASVMNGALVLGKTTKPFNLSYSGEAMPQAERLARNLRRLADQMKAAAK